MNYYGPGIVAEAPAETLPTCDNNSNTVNRTPSILGLFTKNSDTLESLCSDSLAPTLAEDIQTDAC